MVSVLHKLVKLFKNSTTFMEDNNEKEITWAWTQRYSTRF